METNGPGAHSLNVRSGDARVSREALTLDTLRAARNLQLDAQILQTVLATDPGVVSSLLDSERTLSPDSEAGGRALLLIRLHRALGDVFGSLHQVHQWLDTYEQELGGRPRDLITTPDGLERVVSHIEAHCKDCAW